MGKRKNTQTLVLLLLYGVAMALVEAAVVIYLRALYYPGGFAIRSVKDLAVMPSPILRVELWREGATIIMLALVACLASRKIIGRIVAFCFAFSVWDLGYYLFLFLFLAWPPSLSTIDVYFLIPRPWIGPVWIPVALFGVLGIVSARIFLRSDTA